MKKKTFIVAAAIFSSQIYAQTDSTTLDPVIITANRFEQKQSQTGKVVTVISREELDKSPGKTLARVLNGQAGITVAGAFNAPGSVQTLFMRGASSGRTLVLLDGIPVNDPSMIYNEPDLNFFPVDQVERIEICRGALSANYGSDAIGGVINIITTRQAQKVFNANVTALAGNQGLLRNNFHLYGTRGRFNYAAQAGRFSTGGFSAAHDSTGTSNFDKDGYDATHLSALTGYQLLPGLSWKTFVRHQNYRAGIDAGVFNDDKDFRLDHRNLMAGTGFSLNTGSVSAHANYQYNTVKRSFLNDSLHAPGFTRFERNGYEGTSHFAELFSNIRLWKGWRLLAGVDYRLHRMKQDYFSISAFGPYEAGFPDTSLSQYAAYGSLFFSTPNNQLHLETGGRINFHSRYGRVGSFSFNSTYALAKNIWVVGSIATGFKSPSLYQLYDDFSGNGELEAERAITYELGIRQVHEKFSSRLVYFKRNISNGIDYNYASRNYFNFIRQEVNGTELELNFRPFRQVGINANYTFITGREYTQSRKNFSDTLYRYLLRRPGHHLNISLDWQATPRLNTGLGAKTISSRYDVGGFMQEDVSMEGYWILHAYASYKLNGNFSFTADAENLANRQFSDIRGYNSMPFQVRGGVVWKW